MQGGFSFDEHDVTLLFGNRIMANALRNHKRVALTQLHRSILHLDSQRAFENVEKFVLGIVAVPRQRAMKLRDLNEGVVEFCDDAG